MDAGFPPLPPFFCRISGRATRSGRRHPCVPRQLRPLSVELTAEHPDVLCLREGSVGGAHDMRLHREPLRDVRPSEMQVHEPPPPGSDEGEDGVPLVGVISDHLGPLLDLGPAPPGGVDAHPCVSALLAEVKLATVAREGAHPGGARARDAVTRAADDDRGGSARGTGRARVGGAKPEEGVEGAVEERNGVIVGEAAVEGVLGVEPDVHGHQEVEGGGQHAGRGELGDALCDVLEARWRRSARDGKSKPEG